MEKPDEVPRGLTGPAGAPATVPAMGIAAATARATATSEVTVKEKLGATNALYPLVTAIIGATVDGAPDFATIAHVGIAHLKGITLGMGNVPLTHKGITSRTNFA